MKLRAIHSDLLFQPLFQESKMSSAASQGSKGKEAVPSQVPSLHQGDIEVVDDQEVSDFYGSTVSETYRLKSELVAQHLAEIGMGK